MESSDRPLSRAAQLALAGVMIAFAWLLLSVVFGLGAGNAHADDADEDGGVLSSLTGAVSGTVDAVVNTTAGTVTAVAPVLTPVVETVVAVVPPAAPVVEVVADTAAAVLEPVHDIASSGAVTGVVTPVVDLVTAVPVVGEVVTALGVDQAATDVAGTVDNAAGGLTGSVSNAVPAILTPGSGGPGTPAGLLPMHDATAADAAATAITPAAAITPAQAKTDAAALLRAFFATGSAVVTSLDSTVSAASADAFSAEGWTAGGIVHLLRSVLPADSVFTGSGGAGPGAWVLVALVLVVVHRAWVRRNGIENDAAPAAPTFATDVSPD